MIKWSKENRVPRGPYKNLFRLMYYNSWLQILKQIWGKNFTWFTKRKMIINGYSELRRLGILKTLCCFLNRLDKKEAKKRGIKWRLIERDVSLANKFKYSEMVWEITTYEFVSNSPMDVMKEIVEKANSRLYDYTI